MCIQISSEVRKKKRLGKSCGNTQVPFLIHDYFMMPIKVPLFQVPVLKYSPNLTERNPSFHYHDMLPIYSCSSKSIPPWNFVCAENAFA